jgi:hypothetical protein
MANEVIRALKEKKTRAGGNMPPTKTGKREAKTARPKAQRVLMKPNAIARKLGDDTRR